MASAKKSLSPKQMKSVKAARSISLSNVAKKSRVVFKGITLNSKPDAR